MTVNESIENRSGELIRSLQELVRIPSVGGEAQPGLPFGAAPARALDYCLGLAQSLGLRTGTMDDYAGWCEWGQGDELICVLTHLDVVPAGDGWIHAPFGGEISEGRIYGRGTLDDKGPAVACIYALKALAESGVPLHRRVRVLFGLNEETGCACMEYYVNHGGELPVSAFTPDGEFPIINGEKSIYIGSFQRPVAPSAHCITSIHAGTAANVVPAAAECTLNFTPSSPLPDFCAQNGQTLTAAGLGAHASTPDEGINAISRLFSALSALPLDGDSLALTRFIAGAARDTHGHALGISCQDAISGELTVNWGMMQLADGLARVTLDVRCPVTLSPDPVLEALRSVMAAGGFTEYEYKLSRGIYISPDSALVRTLQRVYTRETGEEAVTMCIGGGTYAKTMPNCVAFGPIFPGEPMLDHQPEEFIAIDRLLQSTRIYAAAMAALAE